MSDKLWADVKHKETAFGQYEGITKDYSFKCASGFITTKAQFDNSQAIYCPNTLEIVLYYTPEKSIWVVSSAMSIFNYEDRPEKSSDFDAYQYFIDEGWDCQPEPYYHVKWFKSKDEALQFVESRMDCWGD